MAGFASAGGSRSVAICRSDRRRGGCVGHAAPRLPPPAGPTPPGIFCRGGGQLLPVGLGFAPALPAKLLKKSNLSSGTGFATACHRKGGRQHPRAAARTDGRPVSWVYSTPSIPL